MGFNTKLFFKTVNIKKKPSCNKKVCCDDRHRFSDNASVTDPVFSVLIFKRADDIASSLSDTTLLVHFFGKKGKAELNFEDFYR